MSNEKNEKNTIGGTVGAEAGLTGTAQPKPGALVEDESLAGLESGGVAPKDPAGQSTEEGATDKRENPSS